MLSYKQLLMALTFHLTHLFSRNNSDLQIFSYKQLLMILTFLKVHKREIFYGSDFEFFTIS